MTSFKIKLDNREKNGGIVKKTTHMFFPSLVIPLKPKIRESTVNCNFSVVLFSTSFLDYVTTYYIGTVNY